MSVKSATLALIAAAALGLSACVTATPYQAVVPGKSSLGGFTELKVEPNRYRVTFKGNSLTSRETVEGYLLFRAAELTVQNGYDWFALAQRDTDKTTTTSVDPEPFGRSWYGGFGGWRPYWRFYGSGYGWGGLDPFWGGRLWSDRVDVRTIEKFEASAEVVMARGAKPEGDVSAFDARAVIENLKSKVQYPPPAK